MVSKGDLIVLEDGTGGNVTSIVKMNDGRYVIMYESINGRKATFMQGDINYSIIIGMIK